jgi:uncharacterized protein YciI
MKYVVFYTSAEDVLSRAPEHMPVHGALIDEFQERGTLLLIGTFADPVRDGAMCIFTTREAAEDFVARDPFVRHGLVVRHEIREWKEILAP